MKYLKAMKLNMQRTITILKEAYKYSMNKRHRIERTFDSYKGIPVFKGVDLDIARASRMTLAEVKKLPLCIIAMSGNRAHIRTSSAFDSMFTEDEKAGIYEHELGHLKLGHLNASWFKVFLFKYVINLKIEQRADRVASEAGHRVALLSGLGKVVNAIDEHFWDIKDLIRVKKNLLKRMEALDENASVA